MSLESTEILLYKLKYHTDAPVIWLEPGFSSILVLVFRFITRE